MGRYSLIAFDNNTKTEKLIQVKEYDKNLSGKKYKNKVSLASIDKITLLFDNEEQLINYLYINKIIDSKNVNLFVEYNYSGLKKIPVVYKKYDRLPYYAKKCDYNVNTYDYEFQVLADTILERCLYKGFYKFLVSKKYLNDYLKKHIDLYFKAVTGKDSAYQKKLIINHMNQYKIVRGLLVGMYNYDNYINEPINTTYEINITVNGNSIKDEESKNSIDEQNKSISSLTKKANYSYTTPDDSYSDVIDTYKHGGYEALYNDYDLEELEDMPSDVQKKLGLKF